MKKPFLCLVISGPSIHEAREQIKKASQFADVLEFRLDLFNFKKTDAIRHLLEATKCRVMFTLRHRSQGGEYSGDQLMRYEQIRTLARLQPDYLDIEYDVIDELFVEVAQIAPNTEVICSYHDFESTPQELDLILEAMMMKKAAIYKLATMANTINDSMRMLNFLKKNLKKKVRIAGICLGKKGECTRILAPVFGSAITFATITEELKTAPGQLTADILLNIYRFHQLNPDTDIYGLIGDPVSRSTGHLFHNRFYREHNINAVYVRFPVGSDEAHQFMQYAKKLHFRGLSVTMPLKEWILSELDLATDDVNEIGACNTIVFEDKKLLGCNTDGLGAVQALEKYTSIAGKHVVVIGAGGTAKAVIYVLKQKGAFVTIVNRTLQKAEQLAEQFSAKARLLNNFASVAEEGYDILINATPIGMFTEKETLPIPADKLLPDRIVMDIAHNPKETPLLREAKKRGCTPVLGSEMFELQAEQQLNTWFSDHFVDRIDKEEVEV